MPNSDGHSFVEEKTEVLYDPDEIVRKTVDTCYAIEHTIDGCVDHNSPSIFVIPNHPVTKAYVDMKNRGVRIRFISEITRDNLVYCKELMKIAKIRHLDEVKGNFGIGDQRVYQASATSNSAPPPQLITSTVKTVVEQQQYFFDMLWKKAIPAKLRIKEIEQGLKREFMDTLQDPYETQKIIDNLLKSAAEEILIILPTTTTTASKRLYQYEQEYLLRLLKNVAERGVKIKILVDRFSKELIKRELLFTKSNSQLVELQFLDKQQQNKVMTVIVNKELCLTTEVKDDEKDNEYDSTTEVLGLATYSNSESTVLSYASIFETLWIQAELKNKQKKVASIS